MMKHIAVPGLIIVLLSSCAGVSVLQNPARSGDVSVSPVLSPEQRFWYTPADGQGLILIGSAARLSNRDETIALALEDAARKAAFYRQVTGSIQRAEVQQSGFMGNSSDLQVDIVPPPDDFQGAVESMHFDPETDVLERENALFIKVRLSTAPGHILSHQANGRSGRPQWVDVPPAFPGFYVGVGCGGRHRNASDTLKASYSDAIFKIIESISSTVSVSQADSNEGVHSSVVGRNSSASATLAGFYVLEIWIDSQSGEVWTLAVAKQP
jgi:hypothetical protein